MKKIAIVFTSMIVGGAEKSLINFLNSINYKKYEVSLYTFDTTTELIKQMPKELNIISCKPDMKMCILNYIRKLDIINIFKWIIFRTLYSITKNKFNKYMYLNKCLPKFTKSYDCAISYRTGSFDSAIVLYRINAKKKFFVVHNSVTDLNYNLFYKIVLNKFDKTFFVSECSRTYIENKISKYSNKTLTLLNIVDSNSIVTNAQCNQSHTYASDVINLCTVGRLSLEKGQHFIPKIVRLLLNNGYNAFWYIIGDGPDRIELENECKNYNVEDRVILLGTQKNPYPYIKNCDIYVQPSISEGWCLTVQEARILHKPIVVTPIPVMYEQIVDGVNGLIAESVSSEGLYKSIKLLLDNPDLCDKFSSELKKQKHDNKDEINKLYELIEE